MPQATDLMGVGIGPFPAEQLGNTYSALTCAASSTQTGAAKILTKNVELTAAGGANSAIFQSSALIGSPHYFFCSSSTSAIVYPPVSDYMNGTVNQGVTIAQNTSAVIWKYKVTSGVGYWASK